MADTLTPERLAELRARYEKAQSLPVGTVYASAIPVPWEDLRRAMMRALPDLLAAAARGLQYDDALPIVTGRHENEARRLLGTVYRHRTTDQPYPEIGVVEVQNAQSIVRGLLAYRDRQVAALREAREWANRLRHAGDLPEMEWGDLMEEFDQLNATTWETDRLDSQPAPGAAQPKTGS